jgi:hypothetical protein
VALISVGSYSESFGSFRRSCDDGTVKVTLVGGAGGVGASVAFNLLLRGALR